METAELMPKDAAPAPKPAFEAAFADILTAAKAQVEQSKKIVVTDPTDVDGIKQSREYRLALRKLRTTGENKRKELKEDILRAGRALDGMQAVLEQVCVTEEKRLLAQEEIAERIQAERKAKLREERQPVLVELGENPAFHGPFEELPLEDWTARITGLRVAKEAREAAARKAEADRIAKEKADAEERERVLAENARLKKEADAREAAMKAEREAAEKARREAEEKAAKERAEIEQAAKAEAARLKAIADAKEAEARKKREAAEKARLEAAAKAKAEREAIEKKARDEAARAAEIARKEREAIEAKARAEREAAEAVLREERARAKAIEDAARAEATRIAQERAKVEAEDRAKEEAEREAKRKAEAAPDREKLLAFAQSIQDMRIPAMASECACKIGNEIASKQAGFAAWIRNLANQL